MQEAILWKYSETFGGHTYHETAYFNCNTLVHCNMYLHHSIPDYAILALTHWGREKMDVISQTTFPSAFYWMCILLNEHVWITIKNSLKFVPEGPINNIPALVQIMAWRRPGDKPLSEPMLVSLPTHICVTRLQWVNQKHGYQID